MEFYIGGHMYSTTFKHDCSYLSLKKWLTFSSLLLTDPSLASLCHCCPHFSGSRLRHREVKELAQSSIAGKKQSCELIPGSLT